MLTRTLTLTALNGKCFGLCCYANANPSSFCQLYLSFKEKENFHQVKVLIYLM